MTNNLPDLEFVEKVAAAVLSDLTEPVYQGQVKQKGEYLTLRPAIPVSHWINCFWQLNVSSGEFFYRSVPDNCVDWIFNVNNPEESFIVAPFSSAIEFPIHGPASYFGIRFRILGYQGVINIPVGEWAEPGDSIDAVSLVHNLLVEQMYDAFDRVKLFKTRCDSVSTVLLGVFKYPTIDRRLARFIRQVFQGGSLGFGSGELPGSGLGLSARQLRRLSHLYLGLSPKDFSKVARFQATLHLLNVTKESHKVWVDHYYDQSHYIREFKRLTGTTPGNFLKMSVLYNKEPD